MKALMHTFVKDMKLATRSFYIWIVLIFAVIFVGVMLFAVPDNPSLGTQAYVYVEDDPLLADFSDLLINEEKSAGGFELVGSRDAVIAAMEDNRNAKGIYVAIRDNRLYTEYILQGYEGERVENLFAAEVKGMTAREAGLGVDTTVTYLEGKDAVKAPLKVSIIPIFLTMESAFIGMFLVAAYVFMDKDDGTIKAYGVSPGKIWQYLLSKIMMFAVFGWLSGFFALIVLRGLDFNFLHVLLLLTAYNVFGTILGLILAAFFDNLQGAMTWILLLAAILGVTTVSYLMPSFSPAVIRWLPTYPMQFAFREAIYPTGNAAYIWQNVLVFLGLSAVLFALTMGLYKKRLSAF